MQKNACEQNETSSSIQCLSVEIGYLPIMIKDINNVNKNKLLSSLQMHCNMLD